MPLLPDTTHVILLDMNAPPEFTATFNAWYHDCHLPEICALPGVLSATRLGDVEDTNRTLTLYELSDPGAFETPEFIAWRDGSEDTREIMGKITMRRRTRARVIGQHSP